LLAKTTPTTTSPRVISAFFVLSDMILSFRLMTVVNCDYKPKTTYLKTQ
jgi:hypothetical protein